MIEVFLERYTSDFKTPKPITLSEWEQFVADNPSFSFGAATTFGHLSIIVYCEACEDYIPLFWLSEKASPSMRIDGFFRFEEGIEKAIELAEKMNCSIRHEEGDFYYLNGYGVVDDDAWIGEQTSLTIEDIIENKLTIDDNFKQVIDQILVQKKEALEAEKIGVIKKTFTINPTSSSHKKKVVYKGYHKKTKQWWQFWK